MNRRNSAYLGLVLLLSACSYLKPLPSEDKVKTDLVGQKFAYAQSLFGQAVWSIQPDELKGWRLIKRATDRNAGTDAIYAVVRLEGGTQVISGTLKIVYRLYDQGWQLESVSPDSDFSVSSRSQSAGPAPHQVIEAEKSDPDSQKKTMDEIRKVGTAMFSWLTDQAGAAAAGQRGAVAVQNFPAISSVASLEKLLVPHYLQSLPRNDGWGHPFDYHLDVKNPLAGKNVMMIRSPGRDGKFATGEYLIGAFDKSDYDHDIVWADGYFVCWPK